MPIMVTTTPATLLTQSKVLSLKFLRKRLNDQENTNQYNAEPPLREIRMGATLKSLGYSCIPKNANRAKITKMAPGLEIPIITACRKSFRE